MLKGSKINHMNNTVTHNENFIYIKRSPLIEVNKWVGGRHRGAFVEESGHW